MATSKKPTRLQKFFWLIAGSEIEVLKDCPEDYNRHATQGFILAVTWMIAIVSGTVAGLYFSHHYPTALAAGLIWGILVYAVDRLMVTSLKKNPVGKSYFLKSFTFRALLGLVLAFFISIPFELEFFSDEIQLQMDHERDAWTTVRKLQQQESYNLTGIETEIDAHGKKLTTVRGKLAAGCTTPEYISKKQECATCQKAEAVQYDAYRNARGSFNNMIADNPVDSLGKKILYPEDRRAKDRYQSIWRTYNEKKKECEVLEREKRAISDAYFKTLNREESLADSLQSAATIQLSGAIAEIDSNITAYQKLLDEQKGFSRQYSSLHRATASNSALLFLVLLVHVGFFIIEVLPTVTKLTTPIGEYDWAIYKRENIFKSAQKRELRVAEAIDEIEAINQIEYEEERAKEKKRQALEGQRKIETAKQEARVRLAKEQLRQWESVNSKN